MRFYQRSSARHPGGGRLQIGIGGRLGSEQVADFKSESVADLRRNPQASPRRLSAEFPMLWNRGALRPNRRQLKLKLGWADDGTGGQFHCLPLQNWSALIANGNALQVL